MDAQEILGVLSTKAIEWEIARLANLQHLQTVTSEGLKTDGLAKISFALDRDL